MGGWSDEVYRATVAQAGTLPLAGTGASLKAAGQAPALMIFFGGGKSVLSGLMWALKSSRNVPLV
jgi:hypothetical protein